MHLVQDRLNEEMVVWRLTLDDRLFHRRPYNGTFGIIEGKRIANKTNVEKCLLGNGITGFPCHPHNQCVSYLDTCLQITNQFSIFLQ